jgi:hypothetical protein
LSTMRAVLDVPSRDGRVPPGALNVRQGGPGGSLSMTLRRAVYGLVLPCADCFRYQTSNAMPSAATAPGAYAQIGKWTSL